MNGDVGKAMGFFMRRPMPETPAATGGLSGNFTGQSEDTPPASNFGLVKMLQMYDPAVDPRPALLTPDEMAVFVEAFERTGFTGGINWYRNFTRNWEKSQGVDQQVRVPSLMVMAEKDAVLPPRHGRCAKQIRTDPGKGC